MLSDARNSRTSSGWNRHTVAKAACGVFPTSRIVRVWDACGYAALVS